MNRRFQLRLSLVEHVGDEQRVGWQHSWWVEEDRAVEPSSEHNELWQAIHYHSQQIDALCQRLDELEFPIWAYLVTDKIGPSDVEFFIQPDLPGLIGKVLYAPNTTKDRPKPEWMGILDHSPERGWVKVKRGGLTAFGEPSTQYSYQQGDGFQITEKQL